VDSVTSTVKAVGFSFISPEVVLIMADTSANRLHFYPSVADSKTLDLSEDRPHWVLLKSPDHIGAMASYVDRIDRLIVFGRPDELMGLGLPILDANVTNGQVEMVRRSNVKEMMERIQQEAVSLSLSETEKTYRSLKQKESTKMKAQPSGKTFVQQLKELKAAVSQANTGLNFIQQIGVPSVLRLLGDTDREEFKHVCKLMVDKGGVPDTLARTYFRWVEGFEGEGTELGKAVEQLLYPQDGERAMRSEESWQPQVAAVARKLKVDAGDLEFVARSYYQLAQEKQAKAPEPEPEDDGGWGDEPVEVITAAPAEDFGQDAPEPEEQPADAETSESAFGWNGEDSHPSRREPDNEDGDMFGQDFGDFNP
jgi:hypothetical protein